MGTTTQDSPLQREMPEVSASSGRALPAPTGEEPFFGRVRLLGALERLLGASTSVPALITGEVGVGKTRLVQKLANRAQNRGIRVAWGHCYGVKEPPAYLPFQQVFQSLGMEEVWAAEAGGRGAGRTELRPSGRDPADSRGRFLTDVAKALLLKSEQQPLLLAIEDIHWADVGSLLFANILADLQGRNLLLVCTLREGAELEDAAGRKLLFALESKSKRFRLRGLDPGAVRELVRWICGAGVGTRREIDALCSLTGGNPLFVSELITHLQDTGILNRFSLEDALRDTSVPTRLAELLDLRIQGMPTGTRAALAAASVLGMEFTVSALSAVSAVEAGELEDLVFEAARQRVVCRPNAGTEDRFRFTHPLYQKRIYELLKPTERKALHARVVEAAARGELTLPVQDLALHSALGPEESRKNNAVELCRAAAEEAESVFAYETAARFWRLAIQRSAPDSKPGRAELLRRLGWAHWSSRAWGRAREAWEEAASVFEAFGDGPRVGELALAIGETARFQQDLSAAERWLRRALEHLPVESDGGSRALALLGSVACVRDQTEYGLSLLEQAHHYNTSAGRADPYVLEFLAIGHLIAGDVQKAREVAREGLKLSLDAGNHSEGTYLAGLLVQVELSLLNVSDAERYAVLGRRLTRPADTTGLMFSLVSDCFLRGFRGRWSSVARLCERGMAELRLAGRYQFGTVRLMRAEALLALGNPRAAALEMAEALPGVESMRPAGAVHLARALMKLGAEDQARRLVNKYGPLLLSTPRMAAARAVLAELASHLVDEALCARLYELLSNELRPILLLYSPVSVQRVLGLLATRLGHWAGAEGHYETAIKQLSGAGAVWELILTYSDYANMRRARRRRGDSSKALALQARGEQLLGEVGLAPSTLWPAKAGPGTEARVNRFALTGREVEVLRGLAQGQRNAEIAEALGISQRTVGRHAENIFSKMGVRGRVEAVLLAVEERLVGDAAGNGVRS